MAQPKAAWGMEIGAGAIKAIRLERDGDRVSVSDFAVVSHKKILATPDVDQDEITRLSLGQFISSNVLEGENLVVSVPGHAAFARFAKLPPVEPKKVPDIVKFEAVQQIPFPIDQVEWDYETFASDDVRELEVGIFAITRDRVQKRLSVLADLEIEPAALTLSPVAVYNALAYDHDLADRKGAVIYLDIGTHATDVIIAEQGRCWIRTFPLGGTHFTEAIASTFKLGYSKAEKLKQTTAASKYAKQIMQAMRPVFSDLLQDLQRSIGYYQTLHRNTKLSLMVGLGSTFRIPGLRKFLGQQLQIQVLRLDEFKKISVTGREAASFAAAAVNLVTAYGLALQGVGLARIDANLMPVEALRTQLWRRKTKWFAAAAAIVVMGSVMSLYRPISDNSSMNVGGPPKVVHQVVQAAGRYIRRFDELQAKGNVGFAGENLRRLVDYRGIWPHLIHDAADALAAADPQPELLSSDVQTITSIEPKKRNLVELERLEGLYFFEPETKSRRILVSMDVRLSHEMPGEFLNTTVAKWLRDNAERPGVPYRILNETISFHPDQRRTFRVTSTGEVELVGGTRSGSWSSRGSSRPPARRERPSGGRAPPGPPAGGVQAPGGGFGLAGAQGAGRRPRPKQQRRAPGPGDGGMMGANQSLGGGGPRPSRRPGPPGVGTQSGRSTQRSSRSGGLDSLGPMPTQPLLYPPGSEYYRVPITFEVELIDALLQPPGTQRAADLGEASEGVGS
ncbi:MAG: type IV pilus assembly protein PilM [Planctomycetes bacterium]|nr:type IV pilus assembly protein PilM [Planctomycetota bacterium]